MQFGFLIVGVAVILVLASFLANRKTFLGARFLRRTGFVLMAIWTTLFGAFVIGDAFTDPGGWEALGLVSLWAVPLAVLAAIAWYRPEWATRVFGGLTGAVIGLSVWFAVSPESFRAFEDQHGPVRTIAVFALSAAVAVLGLKRTAVAGALLLILGIVPAAMSSLAAHASFSSLYAASSLPVVTGVLYVLSAALESRSASPGAPHAESQEPPLAA